MQEQTLDIRTAAGVMDTYIAHPDGAGPWPLIIFYMDGLGVRPVLREMAQRFAAAGYYVALPNLYYRAGPADTLNLSADHNRMFELVVAATADKLVADVTALLEQLDGEKHANTAAIGCVGYCLGARFTLLSAGHFSQRVTAAAAIHGAQVAVEHPDSPHHLAAQMRAKIYIGVAEEDPYLQPDEMAHLEAALTQAGVDYTLEIYRGVAHGFAVPGLPSYNAAAAERHWQKVLALFKATL